MLRESERTIDQQVRAMEELDDKSEHMLTLGVAALGGGAALATFAIANARLSVDAVFLAGVFIAGSLNLLALLLLSASYIGFRQHIERHVGPRLAWIAEKSNDATWRLLDHYLSLVMDYPSYEDWNAKRMAASAKKRRYGLNALLLAVLAYGLAFAYILTASIGG